MADQLYLSLWFPNFRFETLPGALVSVMRQFALISGSTYPAGKRVHAASVYPISFTEAPTYQRIYVNDARAEENQDTSGSIIESAVAEATEQLHDDMAYEFEMRWQLWAPGDPLPVASHNPASLASSVDSDADFDEPVLIDPDTPWKLRPHTVRILGFGPTFDVAGYEQNGHLLVDFGLDTPWVPDTPSSEDPEDEDLSDPLLDQEAQLHIQQNIEKLLAFTLLVEKNCGISSRLLWTESGEPLAEKLIARLQRVH